jgi:hypothetical protein
MGPKVKRAVFIFGDDHILVECPNCGMHMMKTDYKKIAKLLNETGTPRGRVCRKCGGVAVIKLNSEGRGKVVAKLAEYKEQEAEKESPDSE